MTVNAYLADDVLLSGVELSSLVDVGPAGGALDAHGKHHAHLDLLVLGLPPPRDLRRVEVRRVVLVQHLPLTHGAGTLGRSAAPEMGGESGRRVTRGVVRWEPRRPRGRKAPCGGELGIGGVPGSGSGGALGSLFFFVFAVNNERRVGFDSGSMRQWRCYFTSLERRRDRRALSLS